MAVIPLLLVATACAARAPDIVLPTGRGEPVAEHAQIWMRASSACSAVQRLELLVTLGGRARGAALRRTRIRTALASPDSLRLEALAPFGAPAFILAARPGAATLLLPRDRRVVRDAPPADLLDALAGLPLAPDDVRALITGCLVPDGVSTAARVYRGGWTAIDLEPRATVYLRDAAGERRIVAGTRDALTVEYGEHVRDLPRALRIRADHAAGPTDLTVELSQVNINVALHPDAFVVEVPGSFATMTVDELRDGSPLEGGAAGDVDPGA